jgi:hypothetical protein
VHECHIGFDIRSPCLDVLWAERLCDHDVCELRADAIAQGRT